MVTGAQMRMARGHLRWSVQELATRSGVSSATIKRMEEVDGVPNSLGDNLSKIQRALEHAGVEFIPENGGGAGVRLRKPVKTVAELDKKIEVLEGEASSIPKSGGPSPEAGMNTMRRAVAENDLTKLRNRRTRVEKQEK